jgi:hypothetical protein
MRRYLSSSALAMTVISVMAGAAQADPRVAVLGIESVDVPEPLAQGLTDALRQRAAATPGVRSVQGKDLVEMKMIFGCDAEQVSCMAQAGRSLGADKLLYGMLKKAGKNSTNVVVALKLLDVASGSIEKFVNESVPKHDLAASNVNAVATKWFGALVEVEAKPTLTITTNPPGAFVTVDGQAAGRAPVTLRELHPGPHSISLALIGRNTVTRSVDLRAGSAQEIAVKLEPQTAAPQPPTEPARPLPAAPPTEHPGRVAKGLAIGAFAAAVVAGSVAIYTWRTYNDLEETAHNDLKNLAPMANASNQSFFNNPNCNPPSSLTGSGVQSYKDHCNSGQTYADATTALWVTAGVLAAAGVVGVVVGEHQSNKARRETKTAGRLIQQSLRIAPVFSTKSGGLQASFEF